MVMIDGKVKLITKVEFSRIRPFHIFGAQTDIRFEIKKLEKKLRNLEAIENKSTQDIEDGNEDLTEHEITKAIELIKICIKKWNTVEEDKQHIQFDDERLEANIINLLAVIATELEKRNKNGALSDGIKETIRKKTLPLLQSLIGSIKDHQNKVLDKELEMFRVLELNRETVAEKYREHLKLYYQRRQVRSQIKDEEHLESAEEKTQTHLHAIAKNLQKFTDIKQTNVEFERFNDEIIKWESSIKKSIELFEDINLFLVTFLYKVVHLAQNEEEFIKNLVGLGFSQDKAKEHFIIVQKFLDSIKTDYEKDAAKDKYLEKLDHDATMQLQRIEAIFKHLAGNHAGHLAPYSHAA